MRQTDMLAGSQSPEWAHSHAMQKSPIEQIADEGTLGVLSSIMTDCMKHLAASKEEEEQRNALGEAFHSVFFLGRLSASAPRSKR